MTRPFHPSTLALLACAAPLPAQDWTPRNPAVEPAAASYARMACDSARNVCVVFGGWNAPLGTIVFQDTWEYDGVTWTQRMPTTIPGERCEHAMCFDSARGRTVMFGGQDFGFNRLADTWEWDGVDWQLAQPATQPAARLRSALAFDSARNVTVLFGGADSGLRGDTWEWNGVNWVQRPTVHAPSPRQSHAMAFDSRRGVTVLFGGADGLRRNDTWEYDGTDWVAITPPGDAPAARAEHGLAYDAARGVTVLYGGEDGVVARSDTWEYDGVRWSRAQTRRQPAGNTAMAMAFSAALGRVLVWGGYDGTNAIPGTWAYGGADPAYFTYGSGCADAVGIVPGLFAQRFPTVGGAWQVDVTRLSISSAFVIVFVGLSDVVSAAGPLPLDLSAFGLTGCSAFASPDVATLLPVVQRQASLSIPVPNDPALTGLEVFQQALSLDPAVSRPFAAAVSIAGRATIR